MFTPGTTKTTTMNPISIRAAATACLLAATAWSFGATTTLKTLPGHVPKLPSGLSPAGPLAGTNQLRLAIGLPLRDTAGLSNFLAQLYDPASTNYQQYLTPEEFARRFGPTTGDYQSVVEFARSNHLAVAATHGNRLLLDVTGSVVDVQRAVHLTILNYHHPSENRDFYAPDMDPAVDPQLPVADVSGLNNYRLPHPLTKVRPAVANSSGSSVYGSYMGNDFRAAYVPGTTLTGAGQTVGLLQFDGYYASDIAAYAVAAGLPSVPLQRVLLDGFSGTPTPITDPNSGNIEVSLDIEMAMSIAPGLAKIMVFEGGPSGVANDVLNAMAASNQVKQLSCSWGWAGGPSTTTDAIFKQMAAQGQSFFTASGDSDAYTTGANSVNGVDNTSLDNTPSSDQYITVVGGTTLTTTGPGGAWSSETVWNWGLINGSYEGSSGGISSYYSLPTWQSGISMSANGGSPSYRNIPDVAMAADNIYVAYGDGTSTNVGGTSCATPLWAGLTALINQQAVSSGRTNAGFLNPALYALGKSSAYTGAFHDITTGNNVSGDSPNLFYATSGYDLCTGWGTPMGQTLIDALSGVTIWPNVLPATGFTAVGPVGGPFSPESTTLMLTNGGTNSLIWSLVNTSSWLTASSSGGTLAAGGVATVSASLTASASDLTPGLYSTSLLITNHGISVPFTLSIGQSLIQNGGFETANFNDWTFSGDSVIGFNIYNAVEGSSSGYTVVHSGSYGAFLGDTRLASLSQSFATVPGQYYWLSLWLDNPASGTVQRFVLNWVCDATTTSLLNLLNPAAFSWTNLQYLVRATGTNSSLAIEAENDPSYFGLDDVRVTPVPSPDFGLIGTSGHSLQLSWTTSTGLVYQVQYKTNLLQTNWVNLNSAFKPTSFSGTILDTNALDSSPRRFYRLGVTP